MENSLIVALHGFLGLPEDWNRWHQTHGPRKKLWALNLWTDPVLNPSLSLSEWTQVFCQQMEQKKREGWSLELWGYSMGGRLALGALQQRPDLFEKAMILSANPGLEEEEDRKIRLTRDFEWANKFESLPWGVVVKEWLSQPVLREPQGFGDLQVSRQEENFPRKALAQALVHWSIGHQPNYWKTLKDLTTSIEWHAGAFDQNYSQMALRAQSLNSRINAFIHPDRGHRILL